LDEDASAVKLRSARSSEKQFQTTLCFVFAGVLVAEVEFKNRQKSKDSPLDETSFSPILPPM
ncbi:hypothetical protein, partial [Neisseria sp. P0014.S004]|uniref:hypothetical protein n=1 Tax=Neisseria sp. P0014.S004 TaxID=3436750 RepID=UPI003F811A75